MIRSLFGLFKIDLLLFLPAVFISSVGLLMIYSISFDSDPSLFIRQLAYILFSILVFLVISKLDFKTISHLYPVLYILLIFILVLTFVIGVETRGSTRWIDLGFVNLQGSELAKPVLALALASVLAKYPPITVKNFFLALVLVAVPTLLVFSQPDLGNSFILALLWIFMVFIAGANIFYLAGLVASLLVAAPLLWQFLKDYQRVRILTFLNPSLDPQGASYNIVQALIALGSGQLIGRGLGRGTQSRLNFLPAERTDFIFAFIGEELGFIGIGLVITLTAFLIWRLLRIATTTKARESSLFTFGAAFILFCQFFVNAGMNMGILPVTGVTLPLVSFGGSSVFSMFVLLGLVQAAQKQGEKNLGRVDTV
ncbi:MAG: rod shape-determining protein RodA [Candidatus Woykebacteria bacterium GWB1_45_5]|uniref:Rod shape-determining protein RodA n=2 Tax=Candidatus Woykeibacteriota TaxID=1817899 RepID=A0A1G1W1T9_9BACT|nr:MAG: rod shape-determining protein RodA [Candidatus Woykebacteria bacterium GWA1_44_8]OGY23583.1 MAG: rod shape-determining protein RodA [Candidatus Woykebacteria bacterium GWB1_45_5]